LVDLLLRVVDLLLRIVDLLLGVIGGVLCVVRRALGIIGLLLRGSRCALSRVTAFCGRFFDTRLTITPKRKSSIPPKGRV
jgi:hypothetical protein